MSNALAPTAARRAVYTPPAAIAAFFEIETVADGRATIGDLFRRKFAQEAPDFPHHIVSFYRDPEGVRWVLGYLHLNPYDDVLLVGGGCTDGRTVRRMHEHERAALNASGGALYHALRYAFTEYADRCLAFFGHCGDRRAWEVDLKAGFVPTRHPNLLVHWHRPVSARQQVELVAKVHALGPF